MRKTPTVPLALLCICMTILLSACHKDSAQPAVCIGPLPDTVYIDQAVRFTSCSTGATDYQWRFGDSSLATTDTATHTYTQPGTYHGSLTAANKDKGAVNNFTIVVLDNKPGYYMINGKYYRPSNWANDIDGVAGHIAINTVQNSYYINGIGFYFYGADNATAGQYSTTYDYISNIHPGQVSAGISLDSGQIYYGASTANINKVTLELLSTGKRHISGTDIWMVEYPDRTDSFKVTFDLREP